MTGTARMATHVPLLTRAFDVSSGDVIEIGTGYFSTTLLHWLGAITNRKIVSYESHPRWYEKTKRYQTDFHDIIFVKDWDEIPLSEKHWGLAFVDHAPHARRAIEIERLKDLSDFIVTHDTEPENEYLYEYHKIYPLFKYRYDDKRLEPWTSVLSNFYELETLFKPK